MICFVWVRDRDGRRRRGEMSEMVSFGKRERKKKKNTWEVINSEKGSCSLVRILTSRITLEKDKSTNAEKVAMAVIV